MGFEIARTDTVGGKNGAEATNSLETRDDRTVCAIVKIIDTRQRPPRPMRTIRHFDL